MSPDGTSWGCRRLGVRYGATVALEEVSFEVAAGTVAAVVGGDGAGKTSLLRALAGTVRPAAGTVRRADERRLGYVSAGDDDTVVRFMLGNWKPVRAIKTARKPDPIVILDWGR